MRPGSRSVIDPVGLDALIGQLSGDGYRVVGPTVRDGAVVYDEIASVADLPAGWTDEQDGGTYRLQRRPDEALFGYAVGPHSWKRYLFPPRTMLWRASRSDEGITFEPGDEAPPRYAFLGVRGCELAAIRIQDNVFLESGAVDPIYAARDRRPARPSRGVQRPSPRRPRPDRRVRPEHCRCRRHLPVPRGRPRRHVLRPA